MARHKPVRQSKNGYYLVDKNQAEIGPYNRLDQAKQQAVAYSSGLIIWYENGKEKERYIYYGDLEWLTTEELREKGHRP